MWCLHFKYVTHFLFRDEHSLQDLRQYVSDRAGYSLDAFTCSFCSDSNSGEKKNKSCLYFSITFNWPVENAGVSLKFYKQTHHYVPHQFEAYLYRWQLSDTISTPLLFCLYNNTSIQKTDHCTLIYKASCFLIKFPSLLDLAMLVNFPDPPFNNWFILSILPKHIPRSKPQKNEVLISLSHSRRVFCLCSWERSQVILAVGSLESSRHVQHIGALCL